MDCVSVVAWTDFGCVGVATVRLFEGGVGDSRQATLVMLRQAFESAGVEFIDENGGGPGVRLSHRQPPKQPK
jgi:hypothetical protein